MKAWTENAQVVLRKRYLLRNERGEVTESPAQLLTRVAHAVAAVEKKQAKLAGVKVNAVAADAKPTKPYPPKK